jgi:dihydroorotate dehydrogenase electron transfer subunit
MTKVADPVMVDAPVVGCDTLGAYRVLRFDAPAIAAGFRPGQFVNIAIGDGTHLLRRPFSVYRADSSTVSVAFDAIGAGTGWLARCSPGSVLSVVGPLGEGFEVGGAPGSVLLVGGGYGTAALVTLAQQVAAQGGTVHAIVGARNAARLFRDADFEAACASVTLVTDDGSVGQRGLVIDPMPALIEQHGIDTVYACGPNRMLEAVAKTSTVTCQVAVEEFMACGIGVCWTCVFPIRVDGVVKHLRSCTEGPVFEGAEIAWT